MMGETVAFRCTHWSMLGLGIASRSRRERRWHRLRSTRLWSLFYFHRDIIPHLDAALLEHGTPISTSIAALGVIQMKMAKFFQPTLMLILRDQVLNAAKCGYVFANRGQFIKAAVHLQMVKD